MKKFLLITAGLATATGLVVLARRHGLIKPLPAWVQAVQEENA